MTRDQFQQLMTSEYEKIIAINNTKGHDYAGDEDALRNFKEQAAETGITPVQVWNAGYIDPGFDGPITLEMIGVHPLILMLRPGMLIAQVSLHEMSAPPSRTYSGCYQGATSVEPSKPPKPT
jgi:hypothetical protein